MDDETRAAFGRIDRYIELAQEQHLQVVAQIQQVQDTTAGLSDRMVGLENRMAALEAEFRSFRDWVAARFADVYQQLRDIRSRLDRLERQRDGTIG